MVKGVWRRGRGLVSYKDNRVERKEIAAKAALAIQREAWIYEELERLERQEAWGSVSMIPPTRPSLKDKIFDWFDYR